MAVASVQFQLDGQNLGSPDTTTAYSAIWGTTAVSDGIHTLTDRRHGHVREHGHVVRSEGVGQ